MKHPGQIVLFRFPHTSLIEGKTRPALLLAKVPNDFDDWLVCMISSRLHQALSGLDEVVSEADSDFLLSGLKSASLIRVTRLAVVSGDILIGSIGEIDPRRLRLIKKRLARWVEAP
ncbi:MAG: type II toxin-antitoxin system PemK/MazF family toxin [Syntrophobacteraceae bacterium]